MSTRFSPTTTFVVVAVTFILVFMAAGVPIPLYNTYRVDDGITNADLAITTVCYLATTALALLLLGRLSDHLGRRPVAIAAVVAAIAGCLVLSQVSTVPILVTGRVLQGLACGLASAAVGSYVIDTAPPRPPWLGAVLTSAGPSTAIPIGALVSGVLVEYGPAPRVLVFALLATALIACAVLLLFCPETVHRNAGALASLRPRVHVPAGEGRLVFAVGAGLVATWSFSGFYQAFAPALTADRLGTTNAVAIAAVFSSIVLFAPVGGSLTGRLPAVRAVRVGLVTFSLATVVILLTVRAAAIVPFLAVSAVAAICQGAANAGGMRAVLAHATAKDRAGLLSTLFLISYAGGAAPGLVGSSCRQGLFVPRGGPDRTGVLRADPRRVGRGTAGAQKDIHSRATNRPPHSAGAVADPIG